METNISKVSLSFSLPLTLLPSFPLPPTLTRVYLRFFLPQCLLYMCRAPNWLVLVLPTLRPPYNQLAVCM